MDERKIQRIEQAIRRNPAGMAAGLLKRAEYHYRQGKLELAFALANAAAAIEQSGGNNALH